MKNILITRPIDDAVKLKKRIEAITDYKCFLNPLLDIQYVDIEVEIEPDVTLLVTSANGIKALSKVTFQRENKIIAIGKASYDECKVNGFENVVNACENIDPSEENLIEYIKQNITKKEHLAHISADITKGNLNRELIKEGFNTSKLILYKSNPLKLEDDIKDKIKNNFFNIYSFFSPRTAAIFSAEISEAKLNRSLEEKIALCLSRNVEKGLVGINFSQIIYPKNASTLEIIKLLQNTN